MSRYSTNHNEAPILAAAGRWAERCLIDDGSVLDPAEPRWDPERLDEIDKFFVHNADERSVSFLDKLQLQFQPTPPATKRLMAEILWTHLLFTVAVGPQKKREIINTVWNWSGSTLEPQDALSDETLAGIGNPGAGYNTHRTRGTKLSEVGRALERLDPNIGSRVRRSQKRQIILLNREAVTSGDHVAAGAHG